MRIGVFDSGVGGLSVAKAIIKTFPNDIVEFVNDKDHLPYGSKTPEQMLALSLVVLLPLSTRSDVIVIACNTLTTNIIGELRSRINTPLVGIEPMIKPAAAQTVSGIIAVCATPATLSSPRYVELKQIYAAGIRVLEPDCSRWAAMIESNTLAKSEITRLVDEVCMQGADVIVLGCTHYHWIEKTVDVSAAGRAAVIHPEQAIVRQLQRVLLKL